MSTRFSSPAAGLILAFLSGLNPAQAQTRPQTAYADYLGPWTQVASNAGLCDRCEIEFDQDAGQLTVRANNGWSATVKLWGQGSAAMLKGHGAWENTVSGDLRGKPFDAAFLLAGDELHLYMQIPRDDGGRARQVKAVFRRNWVGS